jgi:TolA-binding protein
MFPKVVSWRFAMTLTRNCRPISVLVLAFVFGLPLMGITAQDTSVSLDKDKAGDIPRWQPRYKPGKRVALSQRERRTGYIESRAEFEEEIAEPAAKAPESSRGEKRGFFPFKKPATESTEKQGLWPFGKKKEPGAPASDQAKSGGAVAAGETAGESKTDETGTEAAPADEKSHEEGAKDKAAKAPKPPKEPSVAELIGKLRKKDADLPRGTPEAYVAGKEAFEKANYDKAIVCFEDFIEANDVPDSPLIAPAKYFIAKSLQNSGQADVAVPLYQQIQQEHAKNRFWSGLAGIELVALGKEALVLPPEEEKAPPVVPVEVTPKGETPGGTPTTGPPGEAPVGAPSEAPSMAPGRLPGQ